MSNKEELVRKLINSDTYVEIEEIVLAMNKSGIDASKYLDTTIYRKLILQLKDIDGFNRIKSMVYSKSNNGSKLKVKIKNGDKLLRKTKYEMINYKYSNISNPYYGGKFSNK